MTPVDSRTTTRRRLLATAATGVAALAAERLTFPTGVAAIAAVPVNVDSDNPSTLVTSVTQGTADTGAFKGVGNGTGFGLQGDSTSGGGVVGTTTGTGITGVAGLLGDATGSLFELGGFIPSGVYGWADPTDLGIGMIAEAPTGIGVLGFATEVGGIAIGGMGSLGGMFQGADGIVTVADGGTALHAHAATTDAPPPLEPSNTALFATVETATQIGLEAHGRIRFPNRSGRASVPAHKSSVTVKVAGMTSANFAMAVLNTSRSGRWVRAVVCASGKITIYLNTTVTSSTAVAWLVLG